MFSSGMFPQSAPQVSLERGNWIGSSMRGGVADSGQFVSPDTALGLPAYQRAVTLLAESIAQLDCRIYQGRDGEKRQQLFDHPAHRLISVQPNDWLTPFQMKEFAQLSLGTRGNAFFLKNFGADGRVASLYPLHPDRVQVLVSSENQMPYFQVSEANDGVSGVFALRQIHHTRWIGINPYVGMSPVALHMQALGIVQASEQHTGKVFGNGTRLSGVLKRPKDAKALNQTDVDRVTEQWRQKYGGSANTGAVAMLQEGMEWQQLSMSNEDAQLIEARDYGVRDVARIFGIPARMLGADVKGVKSSYEQESLEYVAFCLLPWVKRHEEAMERDFLLLSERTNDGIYIQFDLGNLLRGDIESRYNAYAMGIQWGWLSANDVRRLENLPPRDGGDAYLVPMNMADGKTGLPIGRQDPKAVRYDEARAALTANDLDEVKRILHE
jgi:HK97 family phage portal protein